MKKAYLYLLLSLVGGGVVAQRPSAKTTKMLMATWVDKRIVKWVGQETLSTILQADSIRSYLLNPEDTSLKEKRRFGEVAILRLGPKLNYKQLRVFQYIATEPSSYNFTGITQLCAFTPVIGLECFKGKQSIKVLICLTCDEWLLMGPDKPRKNNFARQRVPTLTLIKQLFPKENFR
ncbi:hypothetical protein [Runella sp.]|uniref:hypothetical protein n=1 Tax=Runella sp. TaxID=1960881 RepID=UPI003017C4A9